MFFFGDNYYGKVDRVPGLFFVRTRFLHVWFVPLVPRESYLFFDGPPYGGYAGIRIRLNWKSVFVAWLRGFLVFLAVMLLLGGVMPFQIDRIKMDEKLKLAGVFFH